MATLLQLKTRIITELNRDDMGSGGALENSLILAITQAIEWWSDRQFWFNRASGTVNTVAATSTVAIPAGIRSAEEIAYLGNLLNKFVLPETEYRVETGIPSAWSANEDLIQIWPTPNAIYTLTVFGLANTGIPASDAASNIWTTEAYDLIAATSRKLLYRDYLRDVTGATLAQVAETEALSRLQRESRKRDRAPLYSDIPRRRYTYDIYRG